MYSIDSVSFTFVPYNTIRNDDRVHDRIEYAHAHIDYSHLVAISSHRRKYDPESDIIVKQYVHNKFSNTHYSIRPLHADYIPNRSRYDEDALSSSSCDPTALTEPPSIMTIRSAFITVESLWAMIIVVVFLVRTSKDS